MILASHYAKAQRTQIVATSDIRFAQHFAPSINRFACKCWGDVRPCVNGNDGKGVSQTIKRKCPGQGYNMATEYNSAPEASILFSVLIKVSLGCVLVKADRQRVVRLFNSHSVYMDDFFTDHIIVPKHGI